MAMTNVGHGEENWVNDDWIIAGAMFSSKPYPAGFADFSDWLRKTDGRIIGMRFSPHASCLTIARTLCVSPYSVLEDNTENVLVYFSDDHEFDVGKSLDQDILTNNLYQGVHNEWAISVHATYLNQVEIESINAADVEWVTAQITTAHMG